ncbi:hypothetical protein CR513_29024, partial [Mucuna pruriens]
MGITMAIEYQVKILEVYEDSTLVIHQLRQKGNSHLRIRRQIVPAYCQEVEEEVDRKPWYFDV